MHDEPRPHPFPLSRERARGKFAVQVLVTHLHKTQELRFLFHVEVKRGNAQWP